MPPIKKHAKQQRSLLMLNEQLSEIKKKGGKITDREKITFILNKLGEDVDEFVEFIQIEKCRYYFTEKGDLRSIMKKERTI